MSTSSVAALVALRQLVPSYGQDGGMMTPAIYDTARVLVQAPPPEGVAPGMAWLLEQQHPDGGWNDPGMPRSRDVPTLAAMLALHAHGGGMARAAIRAGLEFLRRQAPHWAAPLPDDLPVGVELLMPMLLAEAQASGLPVDTGGYAALLALGARRRGMLARIPVRPGTTPVHSWEAWGREPAPALVDDAGSVGNSPAATAAWLHAAGDRPELADTVARARNYLQAAARSTGSGIPGLVPTAWPITRFEQSNALYHLLVSGSLCDPALADLVAPQIADLAAAMGPTGIGFSDLFVSDGDDTAMAMAVLLDAGYPVDLSILQHYDCGAQYSAYHGELQPSVSVTAHAAHALALAGINAEGALAYIVSQQLPDGRWLSDKWNRSWLYATGQSLVALSHSDQAASLWRGIDALLAAQHVSGGWGSDVPNPEETAYAVLALRYLDRFGWLTPEAQAALDRGEQWMHAEYYLRDTPAPNWWVAKEQFRPGRLAATIELAALTSERLELAVAHDQPVLVPGRRASFTNAGVAGDSHA